MNKSAVISQDGIYRYELSRSWDTDKPYVMFIMLNPSTADGGKDDPTIRRCINFAKSWGYGGIHVGNLYAYRSTNPKDLKKVANPWGPDNDIHLILMAGRSEIIICAWGNNSGVPARIWEIFSNSRLYYIEKSVNGTPKHPLYLKGNLTPKALS